MHTLSPCCNSICTSVHPNSIRLIARFETSCAVGQRTTPHDHYFMVVRRHRWRSRSSRLLESKFKRSVSIVFDFATDTRISYRVTLIPDELQGRVNSVFRLVAFGLQSLGLTLTGILLQRFGSTLTIAIFLVFLLVLAIATTVNPHLRHATRQIDAIA